MRKNSLRIIFLDRLSSFSLWTYQQEIRDLSETEMTAAATNDTNSSNNLFVKNNKKFRCPHCEHS